MKLKFHEMDSEGSLTGIGKVEDARFVPRIGDHIGIIFSGDMVRGRVELVTAHYIDEHEDTDSLSETYIDVVICNKKETS